MNKITFIFSGHNLSRNLHTSTMRALIQKWRKDKGLPMNPNACGSLTDGPDYTFLDGRLTPYGVGQKKRLQRQKEVNEQIIKLSKEIDFAVERHNRLLKEEEERIKSIQQRKFKPKGINLLKNSNKSN